MDGPSEIEVLRSIDKKLDMLVDMAAVSGKPQDDQIEILRGLGHDWNTVGRIVGLNAAAAKMRFRRKAK